MGEPFHLARARLQAHAVRVFSSNYALYGDLSRRVLRVLGDFTPEVDVYSIDEAFLNLAGLGYLAGPDLTAYAQRIRQAVAAQVGIPTAVGVASTKTLAKLANRLARARPPAERVLVLETAAQRHVALAATPVDKVWGIGRRYADKLRAEGVSTAAELAARPEGWVRRHLGGVVGVRLWQELHGHPCLDFDPADLQDGAGPTGTRRSVAYTRSFGQPVGSVAGLREAVATFAARAAEKLRRHGLAAHVLTVLLGTARFGPGTEPKTQTAVVHLPTATGDTGALLQAALQRLALLARPGTAYQRAGIILSGLEPAGQAQLDLFGQTPAQLQRARQLMACLDGLNARFGRDAVRYAATGPAHAPWRGRQHLKSDAYTTDWEKLWRVSC